MLMYLLCFLRNFIGREPCRNLMSELEIRFPVADIGTPVAKDPDLESYSIKTDQLQTSSGRIVHLY